MMAHLKKDAVIIARNEIGIVKRRENERTPLLNERSAPRAQDDESDATLLDSEEIGSQSNETEDDDSANQSVGKGRGILIILSLWGLIFLQGR